MSGKARRTDECLVYEDEPQFKSTMKKHISHHIDDYTILIDKLITELQGSATSGDALVEVVDQLLYKDSLLQQAVVQLMEHQRIQSKIATMRTEIRECNETIATFGKALGNMEQKLHEQVKDHEGALKSVDGVVTKQSFNVHEVTLFAERLGMMSFAPADYIEKKGMSIRKPPAPQEAQMAISKLHLSLEELVALKKENEEQAALQKEHTRQLQEERREKRARKKEREEHRQARKAKGLSPDDSSTITNGRGEGGEGGDNIHINSDETSAGISSSSLTSLTKPTEEAFSLQKSLKDIGSAIGWKGMTSSVNKSNMPSFREISQLDTSSLPSSSLSSSPSPDASHTSSGGGSKEGEPLSSSSSSSHIDALRQIAKSLGVSSGRKQAVSSSLAPASSSAAAAVADELGGFGDDDDDDDFGGFGEMDDDFSDDDRLSISDDDF